MRAPGVECVYQARTAKIRFNQQSCFERINQLVVLFTHVRGFFLTIQSVNMDSMPSRSLYYTPESSRDVVLYANLDRDISKGITL